MERAAEVLQQLLDADRAARERVDAAREQAEKIVKNAHEEGDNIRATAREKAEKAKQEAVAAAEDEQIEAPEPPGPDPETLRRRADQNMNAAVDLLVAWVTLREE